MQKTKNPLITFAVFLETYQSKTIDETVMAEWKKVEAESQTPFTEFALKFIAKIGRPTKNLLHLVRLALGKKSTLKKEPILVLDEQYQEV